MPFRGRTCVKLTAKTSHPRDWSQCMRAGRTVQVRPTIIRDVGTLARGARAGGRAEGGPGEGGRGERVGPFWLNAVAWFCVLRRSRALARGRFARRLRRG